MRSTVIVVFLLCLWFGFVTFAQTFHGLHGFLLLNDWRHPTLLIASLFSLLIGTGYASVVLTLLYKPVPRKQVVTYVLMLGVGTLLMTTLAAIALPGFFLRWYVGADRFLRNSFDITIAGMDYGNSQVLTVTTLFWTLATIVMAHVWVRASRSTHEKV